MATSTKSKATTSYIEQGAVRTAAGEDDACADGACEAPETADTYRLPVKMIRRVTLPDGTKTEKNKPREMTLTEARTMVDKGLASWMDPRPHLK